MSDLSINTEQKYILNGVQYNAPEGWEDVTIEANYIDDNTQPSLTVSDYTFPLEARDAIHNWFHGAIGGFEGMPFELLLNNNQSQQVGFKAFLDFYTNYEELLEDGRVNVTLLKEDSIDDLYSKLESLTYGYLESIGAVGPADYISVDYVVEKKFNLFEILMTAIMTFLMVKEFAEAVSKTIDNINKLATSTIPIVGVGGLGPVISVNVGAIILATLSLILQILYTAILLIAIIKLAKTLFDILIPPKRKHKVILLKTALLKVANHLGYGLVMPSDVFNNLHYLPSNPRLDEKKSNGLINSTKGTPTGIPNVLDYGYNCADMFNLAKKLIRGKIAIIGNNIHVRPMNDPFWFQQSTWSLPDVLIKSKRYNLSELKSTKVIEFKIDPNDEWTIDNYKGTAYEIKTSPINILNQKAVLLKGLDEVNFNVALGNRKDKLNSIENILKALGGLVDSVTGLFGGGTNLASGITAKVGVLKQTDNWHTIPKLLPLNGGKLSINHRTLFSSKVLWNSYLNYDSFIKDGFKRQRALYENIEIPFGIEDFKQLTLNPYFQFKGNTAKITNFTWTTGRDKANISFWVEEIYSTNLKESFIEAE
jgi:hypothetical protein